MCWRAHSVRIHPKANRVGIIKTAVQAAVVWGEELPFEVPCVLYYCRVASLLQNKAKFRDNESLGH